MQVYETYIMVYITVPNEEEARKIGAILVEEKLAACVNIFKGAASLYRWQGEIVSDEETVMILKSRKSLFRSIEKKVKELHSYSCPCIVSYEGNEGNEDYVKWIMDETSQA